MAGISSGSATNWADFANNIGNSYEGIVNNITNPISAASVNDREYNAMREDTQYQRLVKDLSAAGLNKWLAVNGTATPSAQAISQTSEAESRTRELGFKYNELFTKALQFAESQIQKGTKDAADFALRAIGLGTTFLF